jgi:hypothetical protein
MVPKAGLYQGGVAQVLEDMGNPLLALGNSRGGYLSHFVPVHLT